MISQRQVRKYGRPLAHLACALPLVVLLLRIEGIGGLNLGENPSTEIRVFLGLWGLRLLLLTLAMSPLRWITGKPWPLQFRRLLGLWSFTYIFIHFVTYFSLTGHACAMHCRALATPTSARPALRRRWAPGNRGRRASVIWRRNTRRPARPR